jgi:hypothetical protein
MRRRHGRLSQNSDSLTKLSVDGSTQYGGDGEATERGFSLGFLGAESFVTDEH